MQTIVSALILSTCCLIVTTPSFAVQPNKVNEITLEDQTYRYEVKPTGDNFTFTFEQSPDDNGSKVAAGYQVLRQIYRDDTIHEKYSEHYIRERARCYVFDSRFHTYSLCFLPNDFDREKTERFWGFTTQMPNWKWLVTRILLPVIGLFGLIFLGFNRRS
jgi:hypothetical protein